MKNFIFHLQQRVLIIIMVLLLLFCSSIAVAIDIVRVPQMQSEMDVRYNYKNAILLRALELTEPEFGAYELQTVETVMLRNRALAVIQAGKLINVYFSPANDLWDQHTLAVKVPIRRGILSYRLLLIHEADAPLFKKVKTLDDLKKLTAGLQAEWLTTEIFEALGFNVVKVQSYDGLFMMLDNHRFNYIPRGVHEVYDELNARQDITRHVMVESSLALYLAMPTYAYVSPKEPQLARRIEVGFTMMVENGDLEKIFLEYYADDIERAGLHNRHIIEINNPFFADYSLLKNEKLWFTTKQKPH